MTMNISRRKFVKLGSLAPLFYIGPFPGLLNAMEIPVGKSPLYQSFLNPPAQARPFVRWWWNGGRINEQELVRELDMLKEKGISGVEINPIAFPSGNKPMGHQVHTWLGDDWLDILQKTLAAAKERGITCDIIVGSGWPFGGDFLEKDEQIQLLALGTRKLTGNQNYHIKKEELLADMDFLLSHKTGTKELYEVRLAPAYMASFDAGTTLQIDTNEFSVNVPEGDHILHYLVKLTGYTAVTHGAPGASGPVLNHYNKAAVQRYLNRMSDAITGKIGPMGDHFRSVFVDSLELRGANWCNDLLQEFKKRRGYDVAPYLPYILFKINKASTYNGGQVIGGEDVTKFSGQAQDDIERVRYDFEITRLELFDERFLKTFVDWCKKNKVKSRVQAYGREYYTLKSAMQLDIPECETWLRADVGTDLKEKLFASGRGYRPVNKFVASAAWLTGKRMVSCEEITNTSLVFNDTLERIKITGDQSNLSGVTHSILHGFNYSPKEIPFPGWVRYGSYFNERNTWWPYLKTWIDYKARLSAVFQASEMQSDIAIMFPSADMWSKVGLQYQQWPQVIQPDYANNVWEAIHQNGGGCDYIDEQILATGKFSNGQLHYGPRSYKTLMMLEMESIAPETTAALKKFAAAGGRVIFIGKDPVKTFGLANHKQQDQQIAIEIQSLKKAYPNHIISYPAPAPTQSMISWYKELLAKLRIPVYVNIDKPVSHVNQVYYKHQEGDVFFISNYNLKSAHEFTATFHIPGKTAWVWDPQTGKKYLYPTQGAKNKLKISLDPAESLLIVFNNETNGELYPVRKAIHTNPQAITGTWKVTLEKVYDSPRKLEMQQLIDFKEDPGLQSFGGVVYYENQFMVSNPGQYNYLDLGAVHGISAVELNGQPLGFKWYGKHIYDIKKELKSGQNTIKIKVTTTLGNYAKSLKDNVTAQQWTKAQPLYSMGMVGPVRLV
ncbi:glycosyl hydrolase [Pedobacter heparinus]|uniref:glycosyl hydrolase n=1 Tax=Pedobacter heparinus TaxID=984 RepID=UPI00292CF4FD|nr:glycosyl hydrolase [Pedobacter heparinus]